MNPATLTTDLQSKLFSDTRISFDQVDVLENIQWFQTKHDCESNFIRVTESRYLVGLIQYREGWKITSHVQQTMPSC